MSKNTIIKKLENFLNERNSKFSEECEVVYFLAEVRKILEQREEEFDSISDDPYGILRFYIDWTLHHKKDRSFIKEIKEVAKKVSGKDMGTIPALNKMMDWFLDCIPLRDNLKEFLTEYGLPLDLVENDNLWENFAEEHYVSVISDQDIIVPLDDRKATITIKKKGNNISFTVKKDPNN